MPIYIDIDGGNWGDTAGLRFVSNDKSDLLNEMSELQIIDMGTGGITLRYIYEEFDEEDFELLDFWLGQKTDETEDEDEDEDEDEVELPEDDD